MAVIVNGDGILTGISSLATDLTDITSGRGTITGVTTVGTLQLGAGVSISSPRTQQAAIFTNNTEFLTVDDAGRVGVGTITPNSDAHPENEKKINVGFITAKSIAGDIDARNVVVAGISTFVGALNGSSVTLSGQMQSVSAVVTGGITATGGNIVMNDSSGSSANRIKLGTSQDLELYHTGSHSFIEHSGTGHLILGGVPNGNNVDIMKAGYSEYMARFKPDSSVDLYYDANVRLQTSPSGVDVTGTLNVTGIGTFVDGINCTTDGVGNGINIGASQDLIIQHNGTNSYIDNNTGDLYIQTTGSGDDIFIEAADDFQVSTGGETAILAVGDAEVQLYHNNSKRFETTSSGNKSSIAGPNTFIVGSTDAGGAHLVLDGDSNGDATGADYCGISHESDGNMLIYQDNPNSTGKIDFNTGGSSRYSMQSDKFRPSNDNACTLGTSGLAWANVFTKGSYVIKGSGGTGVDFAHSASEGTAANILDEYEEGTWTPGFYPMSSAMTISYDLQAGAYRRIGNVVYWAFRVRLQSLSGQMGQNMGFGGFPYNIDSSQPQFSANIYGSSYNGEIPNGIFYQGGVNRGDLFYPSGNGAYTNLQAGDLNPSNSYTVGTGFYFAA